jgi:Carboxypeptidase regulatory-like domain/TonB dependent receptor
MFNKLRRTLVLGAVLGLGFGTFTVAPKAAFGQGITTGGLTGTVVDQSDAVLPNASIEAVNAATGAKVVQTSRQDGGFSVLNLQTGTYTLTFRAAGFGEAILKDVEVNVGPREIGKITLKPSGMQTTVEVVEANPLINTSEAQVSTTFDTQQLANLPLNNGFDAVTLLEPGVVQTHDNNFSNNNGATFAANGQRGRSNNFELDGQSNNDNSVAGPQVFFSNQDALAGVQVITNNFSAQYGRNMGTVVNYITKSGTNSIHGSAFELYEGNWGQAFTQDQKNVLYGYCAPNEDPSDGCLEPTLPRFTDNLFGGTLGLPIMKDKLWVFGSFLWNRNHQGPGTYTSGTSLFPTPNGLTALQASLPGNPGVASLVNSGPYSVKGGSPHPGEAVIKSITVSGEPLLVEMAPVIRQASGANNDEELMGRIDWQPNSKDHLFVRYLYQDDPFLGVYGDSSSTDIAAGKFYDVPGTTHSIGADLTHTFSPSWVNQIRYSFQQARILFQGGAQPECTVNTPTKCNSSIALGTGYLGYGYSSSFPQGRTVKVTQVQDNATWTHAHHTFSFGGEWSYQNSPNPFLPNYNGTFSASSLGGFLSGSGKLSLADGPYTIHFTEPDAAAYLQDDWRVTPDLTLNLGLRWEFFGQAINLLHDETVARESNPSTAFWDPTLPLSQRTFISVPQNYKNFQPRVGFAYNPKDFAPRLVIRGGFAINFDPAFYNMFLNSATAAPVVNLGTNIACSTSNNCLPATGTTGAEMRALNLSKIPQGVGINPNKRTQTTVSPNFHNPYAESYTLGVEWGPNNDVVFSARYVGNHGVGLFQSLNANPFMLGTAQAYPNVISPSAFCTTPGAIGAGRTDCNKTIVRERANTAFSLYNGLQLEATTKQYHHVTATLAYTFSKTIDNTSEVYGTFEGGNSVTFAQNPFDTSAAEHGISGNSIPHVASASFVYDLPSYRKQSGLLGKLLGGYQLNGIWTFDTGQATTPYQLGYGAFGYDGMASYCDSGFATAFNSGVDTCRPVLSNKKAPGNSSGIYLNADSAAAMGNDIDGDPTLWKAGYYTLGSVIDYQNEDTDASGNQIVPVATSPDAVKWLFNNTDIADVKGNPFPGASRGSLHANTWDNVNASIFKNTKIGERYNLQLQFSAYNVFNHRLLKTPDPEIDDVLYGSETFWNNAYSLGTNARQVQIGARITF